MARRSFVLFALFALLVLTVGNAAAQDAKTVLQAASKAMGADNLKTIQISGTGFVAGVGQSYSANDDWPKFEVTSYTKTIDYDAKSSREEVTRRQGNYPPRGGGGTPIQGEQRQVFMASGSYAWNMEGTNPVPLTTLYLYAIPFAELRQLDIWMTPHGFLKAAMAAANATVTPITVVGSSNPDMTQGGKKATIVSFTALGKYRVNGQINDQNLVEMVQTWVANPVLGDMLYETRMTGYKDFGGVKFPTLLHSHQGDLRRNKGENSIEIKVTNVQPNVNVPAMTVPDVVRKATVPPVRVESQKMADGVFRIAGGTHHSLAVDFRDFVAVIEAPQNEERSLAVIAEVEKLIPNKPIRYLVNTHHHFDHLGGLRTYATMGTTIVTHEGNLEFYDRTVLASTPRTMQPDRFSAQLPYWTGGRQPRFETLNSKYVISDGVRVLEVHALEGNAHNANMLIAYLPKEKILVNADLYSPPAPGAAPPAPNANLTTLFRNIQRLKLDVAQHVGLHGAVATNDEFLNIVKTAKTQ
jgi:glyoxylase-like metal-dependent hydrolase (beta-lactamase superfamily II)